MTKEITMLLLAALMDKIERGEIRVESYESIANDAAGHVTFNWLKLPTKDDQHPADHNWR